MGEQTERTLRVTRELLGVVRELFGLLEMVIEAATLAAQAETIATAVLVAALAVAAAAAYKLQRMIREDLIAALVALGRVAQRAGESVAAALGSAGRAVGRLAAAAVATIGAVAAAVGRAVAFVGAQVAVSLQAAGSLLLHFGSRVIQPIVDASASALRRMSDRVAAAGEVLRQWGGQITQWGLSLVGLGGVVIGPLSAAVPVFAQMGTEAHQLAEDIGTSATAAAELAYAFRQTGGEAADLATATERVNAAVKGAKAAQHLTVDEALDISAADLKKLDKQGKQVTPFDSLQLSVRDLLAMDPGQRFLAVAESISQLSSKAERAAIAQQIFGDASERVLALMKDGPNQLGQLRRAAADLGLTLDADVAQRAAELTTVWDALKNATRGLTAQLGAAVAPQLAEVARRTLDLTRTAIVWVRQNQDLIAQAFRWATAVAAAGTALTTLGGLVTGAGTVLSVVAGALGSVATGITVVGGAIAFVLTPAVLLTTVAAGLAAAFGVAAGAAAAISGAVVAAGAAWRAWGERISASVGRAAATLLGWYREVRAVLRGVDDALRSQRIDLAVAIAMTAAQVAWVRGWRAMAAVVPQALAPIMTALAGGDWGAIARQAEYAWGIVVRQGVGAADRLWVAMQDLADQIPIVLREAWDEVVAWVTDPGWLQALAEQFKVLADGAAAAMKYAFGAVFRWMTAEMAQMMVRVGNAMFAGGTFDPTGNLKRAGDAMTTMGHTLLTESRTAAVPPDIAAALAGASPNAAMAATQAAMRAEQRSIAAARSGDRHAALAAREQHRNQHIDALRMQRDLTAQQTDAASAARLADLDRQLADALKAAADARQAAGAAAPAGVRDRRLIGLAGQAAGLARVVNNPDLGAITNTAAAAALAGGMGRDKTLADVVGELGRMLKVDEQILIEQRATRIAFVA